MQQQPLLLLLCFAQVPERVPTKSFVVLIIRNSKSNHLGAQGTFKPARDNPQMLLLKQQQQLLLLLLLLNYNNNCCCCYY